MYKKELLTRYQELQQKNKNDELELSFFLTDLSAFICSDIFGLKEYPVVFFDTLEKDSSAKYCSTTSTVILNITSLQNLSQVIASTLHELEHCYQCFYVNHFTTPKAIRWKKELENYYAST